MVINIANEYWVDWVQELSDSLHFLNNISLHPTTIYRILKRRNIRYTAKYQHTQRRWKKQLYCHEKSGIEIQIDTEYLFGRGQSKVVYSIIDVSTRWAYSYVYTEANALNTVDFMRRVLERVPFKILKIRTDNGK